MIWGIFLKVKVSREMNQQIRNLSERERERFSLNFKLTYLATKRNFSCQKYTVKIFFAC